MTRPLPLTVLAGLSASLREQALVSALRSRTGLVAVVYDVAPAADGLVLLRRVLDRHGEHDRAPVELVGCCLACTVRADVPDALALVAAAGRWGEAVLSLPSSADPGALAASLPDDDAQVDTVTVVVDALLLAPQLQADDLLADLGLQAAPTDRRSVAAVLLAQLEAADVVAVAGLHRLGTARAAHAQALLSHLAPLAVQVPLAPDGTGAAEAVGTGRHDADSTPAQREQLGLLALALCPPACGVTTVRWEADGALHPGRLHAALPSVVEGVVRSRGSIALGGRPGQVVTWLSAGPDLMFSDPEDRPGPARCHLVLTGTGLDATRLTALLDGCLARDGEPLGPDPFAAALGAPTG